MNAYEIIKTDKGTLPLAVVEQLQGGDWPNEEMSVIFKDVLTANRMPRFSEHTPNLMNKKNEAIYIYNGIVYKWFKDKTRCLKRVDRSITLIGRTPRLREFTDHWLSYPYIPGDILTDQPKLLHNYLDWMEFRCWSNMCRENRLSIMREDWMRRFYIDKTKDRIERYGGCSLIDEVPWKKVLATMRLSHMWHGDCSYENIICIERGDFRIIDYREDDYGDVYYDLAKLVKSIYFKHDTLDVDGNFQSHKDQEAQLNVLAHWCDANHYSWHIVEIIAGIAILAMAGSHYGNFGVNLFKLGCHVLSDALSQYRRFGLLPW